MFGRSGGGSSGPKPMLGAKLRVYKPPVHAASGQGGGSGLLFGRPLEGLMNDGELPVPVQNMIARLYRDGPTAKGLFRVSANARLLREVKERLDLGKEVDMLVEVPILAVGATFKDYLRNMPISVFPVKMYHQFINTNSIADVSARQAAVRALIAQLPPHNLALLHAVMPVLIRICDKQAENAMSPRNVGICIGQSLMCPPTTEDVLKNDVPPFLEFVVTNSAAIFGDLEPLPACIAVTAELAEGYLDILDEAREGEDGSNLPRSNSVPSLAEALVNPPLGSGSLPSQERMGMLGKRSRTVPAKGGTGESMVGARSAEGSASGDGAANLPVIVSGATEASLSAGIVTEDVSPPGKPKNLVTI